MSTKPNNPPATNLPIVNPKNGLGTLSFMSFLIAFWNAVFGPAGIVTPVTVASLPAQPWSAGARAFVSDAAAPVFGAAVVGGGAVPVPVFSDGLQWVVG